MRPDCACASIRKSAVLAAAIVFPGAFVLAIGSFDSGADDRAASTAPRSANEPRYDQDGKLLLPEGYASWIFVGANLGIEYSDNAAAARDGKAAAHDLSKSNFHNVYINPEAFEQYRRTGKFPEGTVLVLDIFKATPGAPGSLVSQGLFPGQHVGVAAAVKNSRRPDGSKTDWAYYDFDGGKASAPAFANKACYDCHLEHGDDDNVFVQFYPTLRGSREQSSKPRAP